MEKSSRFRPIQRIFLFVAISGFILYFYPNPVSAQQGSITWSPEQILAEINDAQPQSFYPVIAADPFGGIHVFWIQNDAIMYVQKSNNSWTEPIDLVYAPNRGINYISVAAGLDGVLHLVWVEFGSIYYKWALFSEALNILSWHEAKIIGEIGGIGTPIKIGVDPFGNLHVLFADWYGRSGETTAGNVYHLFSTDNGATWSKFEQVSFLPQGDLATDPRMAFDQAGNVHVVWGQMRPFATEEQISVQYNRINPDGKANYPVYELMHREPEYNWIMAANIAAIDSENLVAVWACGDQARRCFSSSTDSGNSWTEPQHVFKDLIGLANWDALTLDGEGNLYWLTVLRYPVAMYYSRWQDHFWSDPPIPASTDRYMSLGECVNVTVALGNEIHVVAQLGSIITYMFGQTTLPPLPTPVLTEINAIPHITPTISHNESNETPNVQEISSEHIPFTKTEPQITLFSNSRIITISIVFVGLFILCVWLLKRSR